MQRLDQERFSDQRTRAMEDFERLLGIILLKDHSYCRVKSEKQTNISLLFDTLSASDSFLVVEAEAVIYPTRICISLWDKNLR